LFHSPVGREGLAEHQSAHQFQLAAHRFRVDPDAIGERDLGEIEFVGDVGRPAPGSEEAAARIKILAALRPTEIRIPLE